MAKKIIFYTVIGIAIMLTFAFIYKGESFSHFNKKEINAANNQWKAPDINTLPKDKKSVLIKYGKELISNTAAYLGPRGSIRAISNGLNCQSCHLEAGTRLNGNNYARVATTYPKYRQRSGRVETLAFRINECLQRSLNGKSLDSNGREMQAMISYINWIGKDVTAATAPDGIETTKLPFLNRAADTASGKNIYMQQCMQCHGEDGGGKIKQDSSGYYFPPLWGNNSYNVSAGMYRIGSLAAFIKYNMPYKQVQGMAKLTDEDAWDVAAFINSQQRPKKLFKEDWPAIETKPVDYPFGPYADAYPETRHKYGPFIGMKN